MIPVKCRWCGEVVPCEEGLDAIDEHAFLLHPVEWDEVKRMADEEFGEEDDGR